MTVMSASLTMPPGTRRWGNLNACALPGVILMVLFFVIPFLYVVSMSVGKGNFSAYETIAKSALYYRVLTNTVIISLLITVITTLVAYPYAYVMSKASKFTVAVMLGCLLVPFWTSILLRTFAWIILLQDTGLINSLLIHLNLTEAPVALVRNRIGMSIGMVHILLPYAVLAMYPNMKSIDNKLMEAGQILGGSPGFVFRRVYAPLSLPGVVAAATLVFTLSLGFYITPALLGGSRDMMIGQLISAAVQDSANFPLASALSIVLLLFIGALGLGLYFARSALASTRA
jgi:ABC-type spermidine/putrescine transport system permease subunit I